MPQTIAQWIVTYARVGSRGTTITTTHRAASRGEAYRLATRLMQAEARRTGGLQLTIAKVSHA